MKKKLLLSFMMFAIIFVGCKKTNDGKETLSYVDVEYSECLETDKNMKTFISYYDKYVHISHEFYPVNCNYQGVLVNPVIDKKNHTLEIDIDPIVVQETIDCECDVDVSYSVGPIEKTNAEYTLIVRRHNEVIYEGTEIF